MLFWGVPFAPRSVPGQQDHAVQFYRDDEALVETLAAFVRHGLSASQPLIVIATEAHRTALLQRLEREGLATAAFSRRGMLLMIDARETLATFMRDGMPDAERFRAAMAPLLARVAADGKASTVRAFGEMVNLLWQDGNAAAAICLEVLWNSLAREHRFTLLCAYALGNFRVDVQGFDIGDVCHVHTHVLPA